MDVGCHVGDGFCGVYGDNLCVVWFGDLICEFFWHY